MEKSIDFDRREFTIASIMAMLSGVTIMISGCGSGTPASPGTPGPSGGDVAGTISDNHGHTAFVTGAQLTAGNAVSLNIQGAATHSHTVELTAPEIVQIRGGTRVTKTSTTGDAHTHIVTFH
jgi:hypothetical protein